MLGPPSTRDPKRGKRWRKLMAARWKEHARFHIFVSWCRYCQAAAQERRATEEE